MERIKAAKLAQDAAEQWRDMRLQIEALGQGAGRRIDDELGGLQISAYFVDDDLLRVDIKRAGG